jgi:ubiquinone/menaquinone biosynthesis C-methylase UbiE
MTTATVKAYKGIGMEGWIAKWYASNTRKGIEDFRSLARKVAGGLAPGSQVLELAPGPGYFAIELAKVSNYQITGLDISKSFVAMAQRNAKEENVNVDFRLGDAAHTSFTDESFDFILCRAAFKNFSEPLQAIREMHRILKKGGRALIIDLRRDASPSDINQFVDHMGLSWGSRIFTKLTFRTMLLKRAYNREDFEKFVAQTEFHQAEIEETLTGLDVTLRKQ